jgi:hypothetical protein
LAAALLVNDRRTDWQQFLEQPGVSADLAQFVGEDANLYWDDSPEILWFKLGRSSYYSCLQGAGAMFYRGTATDYARRGQALAGLNVHRFRQDSEHVCHQNAPPPSDGPLSIEDIRRACRALPDLDGVVLGVDAPGASAQTWTSPAARHYFSYPKVETVQNFYKYMCRDLR